MNPGSAQGKSATVTRTSAYSKRADIATNPVARRLLQLMDDKRSNLCVAADVTEKSALIRLIKEVGEETVLVKTHADILGDWDDALLAELRELSNELNFLLFEDRKFADIGNTAKHQYVGGMHHIVNWAHLVTAHAISGEGLVTGLQEAARGKLGEGKARSCVLVAQMTTATNFLTPHYADEVLAIGRKHPDFVAGFIASNRVAELSAFAQKAEPGFILMTPGAHIMSAADKNDQRYTHPKALVEAGSDVVIVGRGITEAMDPAKAAAQYREIAWGAYLARAAGPGIRQDT